MSHHGGAGKDENDDVDIPVAMVDVAPTLLAIAAGNLNGTTTSTTDTAAMDGISFASHVAFVA